MFLENFTHLVFIKYYPFLVNRERAIIRNLIHRNFQARDETNTRRIPASEDCCVHHFTHPTAPRYADAMRQYFEAECETGDCGQTMEEALKRIRNRPPLDSLEQRELLGLECAWQFYWLGTALFAWDKRRGNPGPQMYEEQRKKLLNSLWATYANPTLDYTSKQDSKIRPFAIVAKEDTPENLLKGRPICKMIRKVLEIGSDEIDLTKKYSSWLPMICNATCTSTISIQNFSVDLIKIKSWNQVPQTHYNTKLAIFERSGIDAEGEDELRNAVQKQWGEQYIFLGTLIDSKNKIASALFCHSDSVWLLSGGGQLSQELNVDAKHEASRRSWWAKFIRKNLPDRLRRSLRKRLSRAHHALKD